MTSAVEQQALDLPTTCKPPPSAQEQLEFKKLCAAKFAWPLRNERTANDPGITWADWFYEKFGERICDYRERLDRERKN